jgi:hypothetical protein
VPSDGVGGGWLHHRQFPAPELPRALRPREQLPLIRPCAVQSDLALLVLLK